MPVNCGCSKACNCLVTTNGTLIQAAEIGGTDPQPNTRVGWRDSIVEGSGSASNPYTVSFVDSLEYRPWAAEARENAAGSNLWDGNPIIYNSKSGDPLFVWAAVLPGTINISQTGLLVGARVVISSAGAIGAISLIVEFTSTNPDTGPTQLAGYTAGNSVSPILTTSGYLSPLRSFPLVSSGLTGELGIGVLSTFGGWTIGDVQLWAISV